MYATTVQGVRVRVLKYYPATDHFGCRVVLGSGRLARFMQALPRNELTSWVVTSS